jgi:hypothetical protein
MFARRVYGDAFAHAIDPELCGDCATPRKRAALAFKHDG